MAKTPHSGNKNLFSPSYTDDQTLYIRVVLAYNGHLTSFAASSSNTKLR